MIMLMVMLPLSAKDNIAEVLINELSLKSVDNISSTYTKAFKPTDKIASHNPSFLQKKFNFEVNEINKILPNIYWSPKLHDNPTKTGFIIAAPWSVKPLSKAFTATLKIMHRLIKNYNFKSQ